MHPRCFRKPTISPAESPMPNAKTFSMKSYVYPTVMNSKTSPMHPKIMVMNSSMTLTTFIVASAAFFKPFPAFFATFTTLPPKLFLFLFLLCFFFCFFSYLFLSSGDIASILACFFAFLAAFFSLFATFFSFFFSFFAAFFSFFFSFFATFFSFFFSFFATFFSFLFSFFATFFSFFFFFFAALLLRLALRLKSSTSSLSLSRRDSKARELFLQIDTDTYSLHWNPLTMTRFGYFKRFDVNDKGHQTLEQNHVAVQKPAFQYLWQIPLLHRLPFLPPLHQFLPARHLPL